MRYYLSIVGADFITLSHFLTISSPFTVMSFISPNPRPIMYNICNEILHLYV